MASSLRRFLWHTPARTLGSYCKSRNLVLPVSVDWEAEEKALFEAIDGLPIEARSEVTADVERVEVMTDQIGQRAMPSTAKPAT